MHHLILTAFFVGMVLLPNESISQSKKIKRPNSRVGISSVDRFVKESFDLYEKVYMYDGYAESNTPLEDKDLDVLEDALEDVNLLSESAPDILSDLSGQNALKQAKATLQINRAKKALKYSITTCKQLLAGKQGKTEDSDTSSTDAPPSTAESGSKETEENDPPSGELSQKEEVDIQVISKFDFVPGDKLLFFDDFDQDFVGDFPLKWNTNGTGEVVTFNHVEGKWFEMKAGYRIQYIPNLGKKLPEDYTIEFDLLAVGLDGKTSSTAKLHVVLDENNTFNKGGNWGRISLPFAQFTPVGISINNAIDKESVISSTVKADIRGEVLNSPHISIAVNKRRFRLWVNQVKYVDVPQLMPDNALVSDIKFSIEGFKDGKERLFIGNLKVAEGGVDLRRKLMSEGKISTNGILFDSGSAKIKTQSYGIIRQISQVLQQDANIKLKIVGHTDSDGPDDTNLRLSKARAESVKQALIDVYSVDGSRLSAEGKGESQPVADNSSAEGKSQNRRVEFIKT